MNIKRIVVTGRMYKELEPLAELDRGNRQYLFLPEAEVAEEHFEWADAYVAFKPASTFRFGRLQWVHALGAGVDAFLYNREWKRDVLLTRTVGDFGRKIGQYCLSYLLADVHRHAAFRRFQAERRWEPYTARQLSELKAVVYGTGTIGRQVAAMLGGLGVYVCGVSRSGEESRYFSRVLAIDDADIADVLTGADWVINTLPLTSETAGLFGERVFSRMSGGGFINVGRGASVDERALLSALESGQVGTAVLDVFADEPLPPQSALWEHPHIVITPHISAVTGVDEAVSGFLAVLNDIDAGRRPVGHTVDTARGY